MTNSTTLRAEAGMRAHQGAASANIAKLPELAYGILNTTGETIIIKRGEAGYHNPDYGVQGEDIVNSLNERLGVTRQQRAAMEAGSLFGYHVGFADPDLYDVEGKPMRKAG